MNELGSALFCVKGKGRFSGVRAPSAGRGAPGLDISQMGTRSLMEVNFTLHALPMRWVWKTVGVTAVKRKITCMRQFVKSNDVLVCQK